MHFDLEMWKYARELKQIAGDPALGHEHRPHTRARLMGVDVRTEEAVMSVTPTRVTLRSAYSASNTSSRLRSSVDSRGIG